MKDKRFKYKFLFTNSIFLIFLNLFIIISYLFGSSEMSGVRSWGIGKTGTALTGDVDFVFQNPSSLSLEFPSEILIGIGQLHNDSASHINGMFMYAFPISVLKRIYSSVHLNSQSISNGSVQNIGLSVSNSFFFRNYPIRVGSTFGFISNEYNNKRNPYIDAGIQTELKDMNLLFGGSVRNILLQDKDIGDIQPALGVAFKYHNFMIASDLVWYSKLPYLSMGIERYIYEGLLVFRAGYHKAPESYITFGVGIYLWPIGIDTSFALSPDGLDNRGYYQFLLRYRFGGQNFSEIYLNRAIEKATALEYKIRDLEKYKSELIRYIQDFEELKNVEPDLRAPKQIQKEIIRYEKKDTSEPVSVDIPKKQVDFKVQSSPPKQRIPEWPVYHTVVQGDTLRAIATKYYNDPNKWQIIYNINKDKIERGQPRVGEVLIIPAP